MAASLTSCELMRQSQWIQFQKDKSLYHISSKIFEVRLQNRKLAGNECRLCGTASPYLQTDSHPQSLSTGHLLWGACAIPRCLDEFAMLFVRLSLQGLSPVDEGGHP